MEPSGFGSVGQAGGVARSSVVTWSYDTRNGRVHSSNGGHAGRRIRSSRSGNRDDAIMGGLVPHTRSCLTLTHLINKGGLAHYRWLQEGPVVR